MAFPIVAAGTALVAKTAKVAWTAAKEVGGAVVDAVTAVGQASWSHLNKSFSRSKTHRTTRRRNLEDRMAGKGPLLDRALRKIPVYLLAASKTLQVAGARTSAFFGATAKQGIAQGAFGGVSAEESGPMFAGDPGSRTSRNQKGWTRGDELIDTSNIGKGGPAELGEGKL